MLSIKTWLMRKLRWVWLLMLVGGGVVAHPGVVMAHPLGNFTINRYSRLEAGRQLKLFYVVDMAEIPTFQERSTIDMNQDGTISADESERYLDGEVAALKRNLHVSVSGSSVTLQTQSVDIAFPAGQGGLQTMRVTAHFLASWPDVAGPLQVEYRDDNFADRIGWQEVVVRDAEGTHFLLQSDAPTQDVSNELRNYPQDLLQNPMTRHSASFRVQPVIAPAPSGDSLTQQTSPQLAAASAKQADPFAALIQIPELGIGAVLLALLAAMLWGGLHAFTPGHGKTIVAAYLVGSRGTVRHALLLGLTTTVTHTSGVFALGMVTLFASRFIVPEKLYPWLGVLSGILVVAIGLSLFKNRLVGLLGGGAHDHDHNHNHGHAHDHPHSHDHDHDHEHITDHVHDHGDGHGHTHLPLGSEGAPVTWRSLLALGISGGLLPCPSALVVMLSAIALGRVGFGLVLIIAFSMGLAGVLTTIGVLFVHAGRLINRIQLAQRYPFSTGVIRMAPVLSALFISAAGLAITYEALIQAGLLQGPGIAFPL